MYLKQLILPLNASCGVCVMCSKLSFLPKKGVNLGIWQIWQKSFWLCLLQYETMLMCVITLVERI